MGLILNKDRKTIDVEGVIGEDVSAQEFRAAMQELSGDEVTIYMNSRGGLVPDGIAMFNAIEAHEYNVTMIIDGVCASIATIIACACDDVKMQHNAEYMIHRCWTVALGNCRDFRHLADAMDQMDEEMAGIYADRTGKEVHDLIDMMDNETYMTAQDAVDNGFVDEILIPEGKKVNAVAKKQFEARAIIRACATIGPKKS